MVELLVFATGNSERFRYSSAMSYRIIQSIGHTRSCTVSIHVCSMSDFFTSED